MFLSPASDQLDLSSEALPLISVREYPWAHVHTCVDGCRCTPRAILRHGCVIDQEDVDVLIRASRSTWVG